MITCSNANRTRCIFITSNTWLANIRQLEVNLIYMHCCWRHTQHFHFRSDIWSSSVSRNGIDFTQRRADCVHLAAFRSTLVIFSSRRRRKGCLASEIGGGFWRRRSILGSGFRRAIFQRFNNPPYFFFQFISQHRVISFSSPRRPIAYRHQCPFVFELTRCPCRPTWSNGSSNVHARALIRTLSTTTTRKAVCRSIYTHWDPICRFKI